MSAKAYFVTSSAAFALLALGHAWRLLQGWSLHLGPLSIPTWASWVVLLASAALGGWGLMLYRRAAA